MAGNCPNVLAQGTCSDSNCKFSHTITTCETCNLVFEDSDAYEIHLSDKKHQSRVSGSSVVSHCIICVANITGGEKGWQVHITGKRHATQAITKGLSPSIEPQAAITTAKNTFCDLCQAMVYNAHWNAHIRKEQHTSRESFMRYRSALEDAEADKNDVIVEGSFDFDFVDPTAAAAGVHLYANVKTTVIHGRCELYELRLASTQGTRTIIPSFSAEIRGTSRSVTTQTALTVVVTLRQGYIGRYEDRLEFVFRDTRLRKYFIISRTLKAIVGYKEDHETLRPSAPYIPRTRSAYKPISNVVEGVKPPALSAVKYVVRLPRAEIPHQLQIMLSGSESTHRLMNNIKKIFMPSSLNSDTYGRHFKNLLWVEEYKMEQDLERYDIPNASLAKYNTYYYLRVPGLAEKRPSVLVGDLILVQERGSRDGRWFEGHVHIVRQEEVGLRFHGSFTQYPEGKLFHVRFKLNRIPTRRQHQAMDSVFTEDRVLFPRVTHITPGPARRPASLGMKLFNPLINTNPPQLQAVASIVSMRRGSPPFVVFGPPGTGKTITIIEAIMQLLEADPEAKILACAPSNSAADLIASRLQERRLKDTQLFRFYAASRFKNQVPDALLPYTAMSNGHFTVPSMQRMRSFRVVVSTCVSASFSAGIGMARGHFTHIFIDEAGQAMEPEAFVSIKTMADSNTNIVLSGDPKQLGPIVRSSIARALGLEKSYLERLMDSEPYDLKNSYGKSVVKLVKNFRSHDAILKFPNQTFYENELQACAEASVINTYTDSQYLPSKKFPVVFHSVAGKDDRESSSPSFFNIDEITQVKSYVQKLKSDRAFRTADKDIGIIAPYHAQCVKLRAALRSVADDIKIGSVEEFQGQERKVVIISTVRSSKEFVEYDLKHTLGFVANPRRFNVAITRAQALLIIIGDPQVLSLDPLWRSFLNYIYLNGGWIGPDIPWDPNTAVDEAGGYDKAIRQNASIDMDAFARRIEGLALAEVDEDLDANVDRPWRDVE
ncbi:Putative helicase mov-10-B.1 [Psilocybe cubensis]|uniref:Helicase mov-10-B.1 n=2 Tax=Psilocybe cubensis TaxID=181762 RepID=A0ACB8GPL7_PSICU|nr:Putative helicase mov-10-B.1 [Psilocybe cubensis]KAH9477519.1 Putative helicase mov-10-B.1 [Psilocybe cubensis]